MATVAVANATSATRAGKILKYIAVMKNWDIPVTRLCSCLPFYIYAPYFFVGAAGSAVTRSLVSLYTYYRYIGARSFAVQTKWYNQANNSSVAITSCGGHAVSRSGAET